MHMNCDFFLMAAVVILFPLATYAQETKQEPTVITVAPFTDYLVNGKKRFKTSMGSL